MSLIEPGLVLICRLVFTAHSREGISQVSAKSECVELL